MCWPVALVKQCWLVVIDMFRGWLDSFSLVASLNGVYLLSSYRGSSAFTPCLEHVRAGGGG